MSSLKSKIATGGVISGYFNNCCSVWRKLDRHLWNY